MNSKYQNFFASTISHSEKSHPWDDSFCSECDMAEHCASEGTCLQCAVIQWPVYEEAKGG
jgi:hypothetical protein